MKNSYRVLYNDCYGGFSISDEAREKIEEYNYDKEVLKRRDWNLNFRSHPIPLQVFDELGSKRFSGSCAEIVAEDVPTIYAFAIGEYDGLEEVLLKPRKPHLLKLVNEDRFKEVLEYLEKIKCLRE